MNNLTNENRSFAIISLYGKQYKVKKNDCILVHKTPHVINDVFTVNGILGYYPNINNGLICSEITISLQVLSHEVGKKIIHFHKRRRQNSKRRIGYCPFYTKLLVKDITFN